MADRPVDEKLMEEYVNFSTSRFVFRCKLIKRIQFSSKKEGFIDKLFTIVNLWRERMG